MSDSTNSLKPGESQRKKFNVLCVTKRNDEKERHSWHENITGIAEVCTTFNMECEVVPVATTVVKFREKEYQLSHVRPGLDGKAITIGIRNTEQYPYTEWELYTDTPTKGASQAELRSIAERTIERNRSNRW